MVSHESGINPAAQPTSSDTRRLLDLQVWLLTTCRLFCMLPKQWKRYFGNAFRCLANQVKQVNERNEVGLGMTRAERSTRPTSIEITEVVEVGEVNETC